MSSPDVTVAAIAEQDGRFLIVEERIAQRPVLNQPAGHVEAGETLLEAVIREAREETAWRFEPHAFLGAYRWTPPGAQRATLRFAFIGDVHDHDPDQPLDRGILGTHWFSRAQLLERAAKLRSPLVLRCIDDYLGGQRRPLGAAARLDLHSAPRAELATALP